VVAPVVDPVSGQPDSKATAVSIAPFAARWYGYAVAASDFTPDCAYWARSPSSTGMRAELAGLSDMPDWQVTARIWFALPEAEIVQSHDTKRGSTRLALIVSGQLKAALFIARDPIALARGHIAAQVGQSPAPGLLSGLPAQGSLDAGAVICACFNVGVSTITRAIAAQNLTTVEAVGAALQAGTNCGSCRPELKALIARQLSPLLEPAE